MIPFLSVDWERVPDHTEPDLTARDIDGVLMQIRIRIKQADIPAYPILREPVVECVATETARRLLYFLDDPSRPLPNGKRIHKEAIHQLKSILTSCNHRTEELRVSFADRHGLGRWYANDDKEDVPRLGSNVGSTLRLPRLLKSTLLTAKGYSDIDQVKSHPTLLCALGTICGIQCPGLEAYVFDNQATVAAMVAHWTQDPANPISTDDIKALINRTVYGGGLNQWMADVQAGESTLDFDGLPAFSTKPKPVRHTNNPNFIPAAFRWIRDESRSISDVLFRSNPDIAALICTPAELTADAHKCQRRVVSYVLQTVEHFITYTALHHCVERGYIPTNAQGERAFIWGYDGFSWILPDQSPPIAIIVDEINARVHEACGFAGAFDRLRFINKDIGEAVPEALDDNDPLWDSNDYAMYSGTLEVANEDILKVYRAIAAKDYRNFKLYFERNHFKVLNKPSLHYARETRNTRGYLECVTWFSQTSMKECYSNLVYTGQEEIRGKTKEVVKVGVTTWYNDPSMRMYTHAGIYPPPMQCPGGHFNLWTESPFHDIPLRPGQQENTRAIDAFRHIARVMCGGREDESFAYVMYWIAQMIQRPGQKIGTALALGGSEGVGKTLFCYYVERMVGRGRFIDTKIDNVTGQFNHLLDNRILVVINELGKKLTEEQSNALKALITDSELSLQQKGVDQRETISFHRVIVTTNNPGAIDSSRRPFYVKASCEIKLAEHEVKKELWDICLYDDEAIASLYRYFQHMTIPATMDPPNNDMNREFRASRDPFASFTLYLCNIAFAGQDRVALSSSDLHVHYIAWCGMESMGPEWETKSAVSVAKDLVHKYSWSSEAIGEVFLAPGGRVQKRMYNFERIRVEINHVF